MRRVGDERGVAAVVVALVLVVLVGFTALAVDLGSLWWDRKELQNGADAAALALAQSCAKGACEANETAMAQSYAKGNKADDNVTVASITHTANSVTVRVESRRAHWFAPVIGHSSSVVQAGATAAWGGIGSAHVLPLTVSACQLADVKSGRTVELLMKDGKTDCQFGNPPHALPGGFGWLVPDSDCKVRTQAGAVDGPHSDGDGHWAFSNTGNSGPNVNACDAYMKNLAGEDVLVPIYDEAKGNGANGRFHLTGYAAIRIASYCLANGKNWEYIPKGESKCTGSKTWIKGTYVQMVDLDATFAPGVPDYGVTTIKLTG